MKIMTGKTGTPHVTSQQFRQLVDGTVGQESYILTSGENLEPELQTNNLLKIRSGMMSHHGNLSVVDIGTYDEVTIANGTQGMQRIDLVVNRYTRDESSGIESNTWVVIQGTPNASNPVAPAYTEGNLQEGDLVDDCPVFEVHLNGINVTEVVKLLDVVPNISELNGNITDAESAELRNNFNNLFGYAERRGKIVSITSVFTSNQWSYQNSDWVTIGTIPVSMRPKRQQNGIAVYGSDQSAVTGLRVTTNGNVQAYFRSGTGQYLSFSISYLTD